VLSATSGRVVRKVDNFPETPLGGFPPDITAGDAGGNYLVIAIGGGQYAFYAPHAARQHRGQGRPASSRGADARRLGNSGNSDGPHLHFHIMDGPSPLASNGLPFRLNRFIVDGKLTNLDTFSASQRAITIPSFNGRHRNELPLNLQFIDFR
jgi:murein DD-endopeptidase MepM/ murein hydrolase activator NlpD